MKDFFIFFFKRYAGLKHHLFTITNGWIGRPDKAVTLKTLFSLHPTLDTSDMTVAKHTEYLHLLKSRIVCKFNIFENRCFHLHVQALLAR